MDTRKLLTHITDGGAVYFTDNHDFAKASIVARVDHDRFNHEPEKLAAELVRRWNSFPALVEALGEAKGTLEAIAEMSQRHNPETGFKRDLDPYDTYSAILPCMGRLAALLETLKAD